MIPKKYEFFLFAFLTSSFMSLVMSGVVSFINIGLIDGFMTIWAESFLKSFVVAYPTILVVVPQVRKIVKKLIKEE